MNATHTLNSYQKALRQICVLKIIVHFIKSHLPERMWITADLTGEECHFPKTFPAWTCSLTLSSNHRQIIYIIELTNISDAAERKMHRYQDPHDACALHCLPPSVVTLEFGLSSLLYSKGFQKLYSLLCIKSNRRQNFEIKVYKEVIASSFDICKCSWCA